MTEILEITKRNQIAFAICQHAITGCCWRKTGENVEASKECASCQSAAFYILKVMREPTEEMKAACMPPRIGSPMESYTAMIDAALGIPNPRNHP